MLFKNIKSLENALTNINADNCEDNGDIFLDICWLCSLGGES